MKNVVGQQGMGPLWAAVKPERRELFQIDFYLGLGAMCGAATLEIVNHEAILRARIPAVIAVAAVTASAVIAVVVLSCSFDAAFLRKLAAIGANPVRYLAPLLQTTVLGTAGMLLLIAAAAVPAPASLAVRAVVAGCTGAVAVWAVASVLPALSTLVQFLGLRYDAASVDDIRRVGLGD